jgi:DtxR family Mn-dependent transcriptional regulator
MPSHTSSAVEDYLKALHLLEWEDGTAPKPVTTTDLAERLGVSAASATNMLKRLAAAGMVAHAPYRGASLTDEGRKVALEVVRHHRLLETYLAQVLGVPWDEVHEEAEVLEHVLSEALEDRIAALLGHPTQDPHGHPIPGKDGSMPESSGRPLWRADDGTQVSVLRVPDSESEALRYLAELGIRPGSVIAVVRRGPISGPLFVRIEGTQQEQALSKELAEAVWVS